LGAILVGLFAGWLQTTIYLNLFNMATCSTNVPNSIVFAVLVRLSHSGPLYFMLFAFMI
jgi:hypothetical protein